MSRWSLILRNLVYHRRVNVAVALGVAAATAVLTGALVVGTSMRFSLRQVALERLAKIDEIVVVDHFFRMELADELKETAEFKSNYSNAVPAIVFPRVTVQIGRGDDSTASSQVFLTGIDESFFESLSDGNLKEQAPPQEGEILINEQLAGDLGIAPELLATGEEFEVLVRVPKPQSVHGDSALGKKEAGLVTIQSLKVIGILPNQGLARFGLHPTQTIGGNAFVSLSELQSELKQAIEPRRRRRDEVVGPTPIASPINTIFLVGKDGKPPLPDATETLQAAIPVQLDDLGLWLHEVDLDFVPGDQPAPTGPMIAHSYFSLSSREMMLDAATEELAQRAFESQQGQLGLTYLANEIALIRNENPVDQEPIPFSTMTAIDFSEAFAPMSAETGAPAKPLSENGIALNEWAAEDMGAKVGDTIRVTYYDPETTHGVPVEQLRDFVLEDILAFTPRQLDDRTRRALPFSNPPTLANDPFLTPYVPGFSDAESISQEDVLPFPTRDKLRNSGVDDLYWDLYRTTPKAFISLKTGQELWGSRFGDATMVRIPPDPQTSTDQLAEEFLKERRAANEPLGFVINPIKSQWLKSSSGTTPFDALFMSLSMFIIVSAVILIALLFRLGVEQRADQIGLMLAMGFRRRDIARMLMWEGLLISAIGGALGIIGGLVYGRIMIYGLTTWWRDAIVTPFLKMHWTPLNLLLGFSVGILVAMATIVVTLWMTRRSQVRELLGGRIDGAVQFKGKNSRVTEMLVAFCMLVAVGLAGWATQLGGEMQGGVFVGAGCLLLVSLMLATWKQFRRGVILKGSKRKSSFSLLALAQSNVARNAGRSTLTIGLVAVASFLIVAISSFHMKPSEEGTGGFDYIVQTNLPVFEDLNTTRGRDKLFRGDASQLDGCSILSFRFKPGDNASCNNPYQSNQPRILGVTRETASYFDRDGVSSFAWAGSTAATPKQEKNPWHLLFAGRAEDDDTIPVVIDKNTAMYSLKVYSVGSEFEVTYNETTTVRFRVVGFLSNTVLQGSLLVSEEDLEELFGDIRGYEYFLLKLPDIDDEEARQQTAERALGVLRRQLGDEGFSAVSTDQVLGELLAVQNTYLSTFQSLGALGLLFGTFGLATVQIRNMLERRREMALMRAEGYANSRLGWMIVFENSGILLRGLGIGVAAALFAVCPHMIFGDATVPWARLVMMLGIIVVVGFATSALAIRTVLKAPLLGSLRGE